MPTTQFSKHSLARRLKLQQLAIFERVLAAGSLLGAARELHMTQPAVSKSIQELEDHFGQALLIRGPRGVRPTDFGLMLQNHAQAMLADLRFLADDLNSWSAGVSGKVVAGTLLTAAADLLPRALLRLRELAPSVVVEVRVGVNETMFAELAAGELDIVVGLIPEPDAASPLIHTPLYIESLCAVVGRRHPLATQGVDDPSELASMEWILPVSQSEARHAALRFFDELKIPMPTRVIESVSLMTNIGLLVDSRMIALMPFNVARKFVHLGLVSVLPLGRQLPFGQVGYTLAKGRTVTPANQRLIMALHDVDVTEHTI